MGFVDNTQHTESTRVTFSRNCGHSEGQFWRMQMESHHCASCTGVPKYKRRKVSAIRDFPKGFKKIHSPVSAMNEDFRDGVDKNSSVQHKISDGILDNCLRRSDVSQEDELVGMPHGLNSKPQLMEINLAGPKAEGQTNLLDQLNKTEPVNVDEARMPLAEALEDLESAAEPVKISEIERLDRSKDLNKVTSPAKKILQCKYPPRRSIYAIRDFPKHCGKKTVPVVTENSAKLLDYVEDKNMDCKILKEDMKQMGDNFQNGDVNEGILNEAVSQLNMNQLETAPEVTKPKHMRTQDDSKAADEFNDLEFAMNREVVQGLMAERTCPWRQGKRTDKSYKFAAGIGESGGNKDGLLLLEHQKATLHAKKKEVKNLYGAYIKYNSSSKEKASQDMGQIIVMGKDNKLEKKDNYHDYRLVRRRQNLHVSLPPSCPSASKGGDDGNNGAVSRSKVRETLRLFQAICRKLLQEEESKVKEDGNARRRVDLQAAKILKDKGKYVNAGKQIIGPVPGVEVGDEFQYRIELNIIGLHRQIQGGIDYVKQGGTILATSIVASGGYDDETDESDVLTYMGQGGNMSGGGKNPEDQKLERGNLALKNSKDAKNLVRVIRGDSKMLDSSDSRGRTYIYDGLYLVEKVWQAVGPHDKLVFKFKLVRIPGQPELAWKVVKKSKNIKAREGLCVDDISQGGEKIPICALNNIDDEKPPPFRYLSRMIYPDWCHPVTPKGCNCTQGCSESSNCSCVAKNGGEIPYNHNGAIVEAKPLVYECGPSCKCPLSCYNRVSQHGIKFQLEIFKTDSRGWGVRSLNSIPSGSFICEYIGELLEEKEAERRTGNDEYLFDIGNNYNDKSLWGGLSTLTLDAQASSHEVQKDGSFTIDAAEYGNVGRFINHSCSPNLYAQNVLYDHDDKRMPHIMLFSAENIPPLQELTYHYNYMIDQVFDSSGNIKKKNCYCGSVECAGRMY